jgi:hypothetical protein
MDSELGFSSESNELASELDLFTLEDQKKKYKAQEKYIEAQVISQKIKEIKAKSHKDKLLQLKDIQNSEKELVDRSFSEESSQFEAYWNSSIASYTEKCNAEINLLVTKHTKKIKNRKEKLENEIMANFKPSPGLLNLMKCKEQAVKQEKYIEAQLLLVQIDQLRSDEERRYIEVKRSSIDQIIINSNAEFEKKLNNLKKRQKTALDEMNKQRKEDYEKLVKKYENLKRELENNQHIKINIHEGKHTTVAGRHHSPDKNNQSTLSPLRHKSLIYKQQSLS